MTEAPAERGDYFVMGRLKRDVMFLDESDPDNPTCGLLPKNGIHISVGGWDDRVGGWDNNESSSFCELIAWAHIPEPEVPKEIANEVCMFLGRIGPEIPKWIADKVKVYPGERVQTGKENGKEESGMKIKLEPWAIMPTRAHQFDAGLDIYAPEDQIVPAKEAAIFDTGVHVQLEPGTVGMLKSKSGLNVNHGILSEGVIDSGYTGSIVVKLYNLSGYDYHVKRGDKISQLVILPCILPDLEQVDELDESERGTGGFGSTGR